MQLFEAMHNIKKNVNFNEDKSALSNSIDALNEIDRLAGDDERLQKLGRKLGLKDFKKYLKDNNLLKESSEFYTEDAEEAYDYVQNEMTDEQRIELFKGAHGGMSPNDMEHFWDWIDMMDSDELVDLVNLEKMIGEDKKPNAEEFVKDVEIMKKTGIWDGRDETYQAAKKKLDDIRELTKDWNKPVDLSERKLTEDRYYYGEVERVKDSIKSQLMGIGHIREALREAYDENEEDYSQEMIDTLGEADSYFEGVEKECKKICDKLTKVFPSRIRQATPEEMAEIRKMMKNKE